MSYIYVQIKACLPLYFIDILLTYLFIVYNHAPPIIVIIRSRYRSHAVKLTRKTWGSDYRLRVFIRAWLLKIESPYSRCDFLGRSICNSTNGV